MRFSTVLFDLDGTLIDSGAIILESFRHATRTVLEREIPDEQLLALVGRGLHEEMHAIDSERADELIEVYRAHNRELHDGLQACSGIERVLETLHGEGRTLGIVTSKRRAGVDLAFEMCALERFFELVVTVEDTERHKPDPGPIRFALDRLGTGPSEAAYVGDSPFDVAAAKGAGVFSIAVTWGGMHGRERLEATGPDGIVDRARELYDLL